LTNSLKPVVIAGAASGVGKTTVAVGLMGALKRRGLRVAPFKSGPDYIDPSYHLAVTGVGSRNLDTWLTSPETVRRIYARGAADADAAIIEGAMGLFDGRSGAGDQCSTAEIARLTGGAAVLVVDCARQARSLAPVLAGFAAFDPSLELAGAILNNVGSASHARVLEDAAREAGVPVFGVLPRRGDISLRSRHLGLVPAGEGMDRTGSAAGGEPDSVQEVLERIIDHVEANLDIEGIMALGKAVSADSAAGPAAPTNAGAARRVRLGIALDEAFSFYYVDSLEALAEAGAELVYFSPLHDAALPVCDGLYLGGGYPEVFAAGLESNAPMREAVAAAVNEGMPVYAECGGLVYLCREVEVDGLLHQMAGALPFAARMMSRRQALGYVEAAARGDDLLHAAGEHFRGHEFHWSAVDWREDRIAFDCYSAFGSGGSGSPGRDIPGKAQSKPDGYAAGNLLASYVHINFAGNPEAASRFVAACAGDREVTSSARG